MKILYWATIILGILLSCFWAFIGISMLVLDHYLAAFLDGLLIAYILKDVIDNIKALSANNGSSHEESE